MSSRRFPGKVLAKLQGKTIVEHVVGVCQTQGLPVFVLTSDDPSDDQLVDFMKNRGINFYRGNLVDVLHRYRSFTDDHNLDRVVRLNCDSPLIHPKVIERVISESKQYPHYELTTNVFPRTFPRGQSVEVISAKALQMLRDSDVEYPDIEHVTSFLYKNHKNFRIRNVENEIDMSKISLCVDTEDDLLGLELLLNKMEITISKGLPEWQIFSKLIRAWQN